MRKFTLLLIVIAFVSNVVAQKAYIPEVNESCNLTGVKHYSQSEYNDLKSTTLWGDVMWEEDFSGGQVPTDWVLVDNNGLNYLWYWSDDLRPGIAGTYSINNDTFFATTASNGYIMLSGDIYNMGSGSFVDMDSYFITAPINCDTATSVMVEFQQYFRNCCSSATASMLLSVSVDNVNWVDYDVMNGVAINAWSENADLVRVNITQIAAGQSTVYLKFHKSGASHYFWAIDDMKLITAPQNEIFIDETYNSFIATFGTGSAHSGYYSQIPEKHIMPLYLAADIKNDGDQVQTGVTFNAKVFNEAGTELFNQTDDTTQLSFDSIAYLEMADFFTATAIDKYTITWESYQNEVDEIPANNISEDVSFSVVENSIYARDISRTTTTSPDQYVDGADGDFIGVEYYIAQTDTVKSISVYVDYRTTVNSVVIGQLYLDESIVIESEEYYISESDLGTWVEIDFITVNTGDDILLAESIYYAGVECYWGGDDNDFLLGADDTDPHLFQYESVLRIGSGFGWINELPMVRINMVSAITPPSFTSAPELTCPLNMPYDYVATVADQGLTNTFEVTSNIAIGISGSTSGNSVTISSDTPQSVGLAVDDRFRVRVVADNGVATNEQYYYVTVTEAIGIDETSADAINIYPNPAQDVLNITNVQNADIYVYNLLGEVVANVKDASSFTTINLANLAPGSYIVTVVKADSVFSKQFSHVK